MKQVSPNEFEAYRDFAKHTVNMIKHYKPIGCDLIWHYTEGDKLISIINQKAMWGTQIACLNDPNEIRLSANMFMERFGIAARQSVEEREKHFLEKIVTGLKEAHLASMGTFVVCFSTIGGDDLSQWRAYGGGESGYSLGFRVRDIERYCQQSGCVFEPAIYDKAIQQKIAEHVLQGTLRFYHQGRESRRGQLEYEQWVIEFLEVWARQISYVAALMKSESFSAENEIRIVRWLQDGEHDHLKYVQRRTMMTRHLPLHFVRQSLASIIVGPCSNRSVSRITVGDLLKANKFSGVVIDESQLAYRVP